MAAATDALFRGMATRAMSEARYASFRVEGSNNSHYGLALTLYTHFTSPIRRYADVVVHRQLMDAVTGGGDGDDEKSAPGTSKSFSSPAGLAQVADHLNERNRGPCQAQAEPSLLYLLETRVAAGRVERAVVHEIKDDGFVAFVPRFHVRVGVRLVSDKNTPASAEEGDDVSMRRDDLPAMGTTFGRFEPPTIRTAGRRPLESRRSRRRTRAPPHVPTPASWRRRTPHTRTRPPTTAPRPPR